MHLTVTFTAGLVAFYSCLDFGQKLLSFWTLKISWITEKEVPSCYYSFLLDSSCAISKKNSHKTDICDASIPTLNNLNFIDAEWKSKHQYLPLDLPTVLFPFTSIPNLENPCEFSQSLTMSLETFMLWLFWTFWEII